MPNSTDRSVNNNNKACPNGKMLGVMVTASVDLVEGECYAEVDLYDRRTGLNIFPIACGSVYSAGHCGESFPGGIEISSDYDIHVAVLGTTAANITVVLYYLPEGR